MSKELEEPTDESVDNSEESEATSDDSAQAEQSPWKPSDPRFKSPEDLEKSYKELESKLGDYKATAAKAELANASIKALAADRNLSFTEAEKVFAEETNDLLRKHGNVIADKETQTELQRLNLKIEKRDLLDEYPESKEVIERVMDWAERTGESPQKIYERDFKKLLDKTMTNESNTNRPVRRAPDSDERPDESAKREAELLEKAQHSRTGEFNKDLEALLKQKRFGRK